MKSQNLDNLAGPGGRAALVQTPRPYRSIAVKTGSHILHAGTPLDDQARSVIAAVKSAAGGH